jgi:hypothetical protein
MGLCGFLQDDSNSFNDINILGKWGLMGFFKGILNGTRAGEQGGLAQKTPLELSYEFYIGDLSKKVL